MAKGVALHNLGSCEEAVDCLDQALVIDPGNPAAWSLKGNILDSMGRPDDAAHCYTNAGALDARYHPAPAVTVLPTPPPVDANGGSSGPSPPHHTPTIFIFSLEDAIDIASEPLFIPLSLPPGYSFRGGSLNAEGAVSLWISNETNSIRYIQASLSSPVSGVLEGSSTQIGEFQGRCTEMGGQRQLSWSDAAHDYYLIGNLPCEEYLPIAQSLGRLTSHALDLVPWERPVPATPLPPSEIMNLVFSLDWLNAHDTDPDPRIFNVTMTQEEFESSFSPDRGNPLLSRHHAVEDDQSVALLNIPAAMFARFNPDPDEVTIYFPDSFFRFYDSMDALYEDLRTGQGSGSETIPERALALTPQTIPSPPHTTPVIYY